QRAGVLGHDLAQVLLHAGLDLPASRELALVAALIGAVHLAPRRDGAVDRNVPAGVRLGEPVAAAHHAGRFLGLFQHVVGHVVQAELQAQDLAVPARCAVAVAAAARGRPLAFVVTRHDQQVTLNRVSYPPGIPVHMVALQPLKQWTQAGPRPPVSPGQGFWADGKSVPNLITGGWARLATISDPVPPPYPPYTAAGVPGLGAGTANSSPA